MRWANTGWRVDNNARLIKLASRIFNFRNLVFRMCAQTNRREEYATRAVQRNCGHKKAQRTSHKKAQKAQNLFSKLFRAFCAFVATVFALLLALDDLYVRIELDIEVARIKPLVLFQVRQTHRRRVVVLLHDLGLNGHAG